MRPRASRSKRPIQGMSLLETVMSLTIFAGLSTVFLGATRMSIGVMHGLEATQDVHMTSMTMDWLAAKVHQGAELQIVSPTRVEWLDTANFDGTDVNNSEVNDDWDDDDWDDDDWDDDDDRGRRGRGYRNNNSQGNGYGLGNGNGNGNGDGDGDGNGNGNTPSTSISGTPNAVYLQGEQLIWSYGETIEVIADPIHQLNFTDPTGTGRSIHIELSVGDASDPRGVKTESRVIAIDFLK